MGRRIAFLIGNQEFHQDSGLAPLRGPLNDVAELSRILGDPNLGQFEVRPFTNAASYEIKRALEEELSSSGMGDMILIHYAGHGKLDRIGNLCLATSDTRSKALHSTSIPARQVRDLASASDCEAIILLLDCCYSGVAAGLQRGDVSSQLASLQSAGGLYILSASSEIQTAGETEVEQNGKVMGRFTAALVEGIESGQADHDGDGKISLFDLARHIKNSVRQQTPKLLTESGSGDPLISLVKWGKQALDGQALAELESANWRHRIGAVAYLHEMLRTGDARATTAAKAVLLEHLKIERDFEVQKRIKDALSTLPLSSGAGEVEIDFQQPQAHAHRVLDGASGGVPPDKLQDQKLPVAVPEPTEIRPRRLRSYASIVIVLLGLLGAWGGGIYIFTQMGSKPTIKSSDGRYEVYECGAILDQRTGYYWYVGAANLSWSEADYWANNLNDCEMKWQMPTAADVLALFDEDKRAGSGYVRDGRTVQAYIDPVFDGIGGTAWVWAIGPQDSSYFDKSQATAVNLNQNIPVKLSASGTAYPAAAFAISQKEQARSLPIEDDVLVDQSAPEPGEAQATEWSVQIASQPSLPAAESSYSDLKQRYSSVIQGKEVRISAAEIADKGTFYRVRVVAASRDEAIQICDGYKALGGNCFVTR